MTLEEKLQLIIKHNNRLPTLSLVHKKYGFLIIFCKHITGIKKPVQNELAKYY
jgi:hypothetical protein